MRAFLHLGTEKTGTSTIQRFLKKNREALMDQGYYFMKSTGEADDRKLSAYCLLESQFDEFHRNHLIDNEEKKLAFEKRLEKEFEKEFSSLPPSIHTVIFSSEHFQSRVKVNDQALKLKAFLSRYFDSFSLLSYIRPQVDMLVSHYSTYLKSYGVVSLSEYAESCNPANYYYDYWRYLSLWDSVFSDSKFNVRIFERSEFFDGDVVADFCHAVGLDSTLLEYIDAENESVNPTGQELLKVINRKFDDFVSGLGKNPTRTAFVNIISQMFPGSGERPRAKKAHYLQDQFAEINEQVRKRWFPERSELFNLNYKKFDQQEEVDWKVVDFFESFVEKYCKINGAQLAGISSPMIDNLRDIALKIEEEDLSSAFNLMQVASILRPDGTLISKKIKEYRLNMEH